MLRETVRQALCGREDFPVFQESTAEVLRFSLGMTRMDMIKNECFDKVNPVTQQKKPEFLEMRCLLTLLTKIHKIFLAISCCLLHILFITADRMGVFGNWQMTQPLKPEDVMSHTKN